MFSQRDRSDFRARESARSRTLHQSGGPRAHGAQRAGENEYRIAKCQTPRCLTIMAVQAVAKSTGKNPVRTHPGFVLSAQDGRFARALCRNFVGEDKRKGLA